MQCENLFDNCVVKVNFIKKLPQKRLNQMSAKWFLNGQADHADKWKFQFTSFFFALFVQNVTITMNGGHHVYVGGFENYYFLKRYIGLFLWK